MLGLPGLRGLDLEASAQAKFTQSSPLELLNTRLHPPRPRSTPSTPPSPLPRALQANVNECEAFGRLRASQQHQMTAQEAGRYVEKRSRAADSASGLSLTLGRRRDRLTIVQSVDARWRKIDLGDSWQSLSKHMLLSSWPIFFLISYLYLYPAGRQKKSHA